MKLQDKRTLAVAALCLLTIGCVGGAAGWCVGDGLYELAARWISALTK